jgi:hypothetical protein
MKFELDVTQTSAENGRRRMALIRAEYPQTRWTDPTCTDENPAWGPIREEWIKGEGMVAYPGPQQSKPCSHKAEVHAPKLQPISDVHWIAGRRGKDGAFHRPKEQPFRFTGNIAKATLENIAACAALGLSYWSDAPGTNKIWAVDANQVPHSVLIDRKVNKAEHYCAQTWRYDPATQGPREGTKTDCGGEFSRVADWAVAPTMTDLFDQMDTRRDVSAEYGVTGHCLSGRHENCRSYLAEGITTSFHGVYRCPCECHETMPPITVAEANDEVAAMVAARNEEEPMTTKTKTPTRAQTRAAAAAKAKRESEIKRASSKAVSDARVKAMREAEALNRAITPKPMSREVARSLLLHDPEYLGDITNEALVDLLDDETVKKFHPRIRRELRVNRGLTQKAS